MYYIHRLIKTQIGHARDFAWYRGQRPSPARVILLHDRVQIHAKENLCSYATNPPHFRVRELLLCDILITRAGDGRWPRYQAKSLACPGCDYIPHPKIPVIWLVKSAGIILTVPTKMTMPGAQSIGVERVLCSSCQNHIDARVNVFAQLLRENASCRRRSHFKIILW